MEATKKSCEACGAEMLLVPHERTGRFMPLVPDTEGGYVVHAGDVGRGRELVAHHVGAAAVGADVTRYKSHFADCRDAARFRR